MALVLQVGLDLEFRRETEPVVFPMAQAAAEFRLHRRLAQISDVPDHPRQGQPGLRRNPPVVAAAVPIGIRVDRLPRQFVQRDGLRGTARGRRQHDRAAHPLGIGRTPLQRLHPAQAAAGHGQQLFDAQLVQQPPLRLHHVGHRHDRKRQPVRPARPRIDRSGPRAAVAAAEHVGAHDEITIRVERLAGTYRGLPPAGSLPRNLGMRGHVRVARKRVADQDRVVFPLVQLPVGLVGQIDGPKRGSALKPHFRRDGLDPDRAHAVPRFRFPPRAGRARAPSRSASKSFTCSMPTDNRTRLSRMPRRFRSSAGSEACVMRGG